MPSIGTLVTDPNAFFRDRSESPSLKGPTLVVTLSMVFSVVGAIVGARAISSMMSSSGLNPTFATFTQIGAVIIAFVGPYIAWVLFSGLFYAVSVLFDGDGGFKTTFALVGWGFLPSVVGSFFTAAITVYRWEIRGVDVPPLPPNLETQANIQQFQSALQEVNSGFLPAMPALLGIVFGLWSAVLYVFALQHGRNISRKEAVLTIALPVLVGVGLSIFNVYNTL
jgi:hypothetical protein